MSAVPYAPPPEGARPAAVPGAPPASPVPLPPLPSRFCNAAMTCGIVSMVLVATVYGTVISVLLGPVALVLGLLARRRVGRGEEVGRGFALTGIVLGAVSFLISAVALTLFVLALTVWDERAPSKDDSSGGSRVQAAQSYS